MKHIVNRHKPSPGGGAVLHFKYFYYVLILLMVKNTVSNSNPDIHTLNSQKDHWQKMYAQNAAMFGNGPSYSAVKTAGILKAQGANKILELGSGQGRDTLFFALQGCDVYALDYSEEGLSAIRKGAEANGVSSSVKTVYHDVRRPFPFDNDLFDACYSHMLYCMALTTAELKELSREILRILRPGGLNIYTVRTTQDPHYRTGIDRGDDIWEIAGGFIVHFFSREKIEDLAEGFQIINIEEFDETRLPKKLFLVTTKKI